jgi:hypothetical protein
MSKLAPQKGKSSFFNVQESERPKTYPTFFDTKNFPIIKEILAGSGSGSELAQYSAAGWIRIRNTNLDDMDPE